MEVTKEQMAANIEKIRQRIEKAALSSCRDPKNVRLCAVCNLPVDHSPEGDSLSESFYSIAQARQKAESLGLPLSGQFVLQMLWYTQENGIFRTYNKALFPILSEK